MYMKKTLKTYRVTYFDSDGCEPGQVIVLTEFEAKDKRNALRQFEAFKTFFRETAVISSDADELELYRIDVKEKKTKIV
jgi:ASC-1-like (ASCH) protein